MSEYIRTNKFDTNECPNIFVKEKLIRTNVRIYIHDQYIRIFEYLNIFVTLWHGWETWQNSINFYGQRVERDLGRWNLPWLSTRNSVCAVRQTWGENLLIFWDPKMDENNFKSQTVLVFCWAVAVVWFAQSVWPDPAPHDLFGGCICLIWLTWSCSSSVMTVWTRTLPPSQGSAIPALPGRKKPAV